MLAVGSPPAYAGKSRGPRKGSRCRQDHPRVCGEKEMLAQAGAIWVGSPPRMRGKVWPMSTPLSPVRITPAYAGKRTPYIPMSSTPRDHPRTCGEKIEYTGIHRVVLGSPPHMRGKVALLGEGQVKLGITLAYARKSETAAGHSIAGSGSPLRMRGKDICTMDDESGEGITPAYAGKSCPFLWFRRRYKDHPRICGEKRFLRPSLVFYGGSPPHMRGKVADLLDKWDVSRITPAYAGKRRPALLL